MLCAANLLSISGQHCCNQGCLRHALLGFEAASAIHDEWDIGARDKMKKLTSYLASRRIDSTDGNKIGGSYYKLALEWYVSPNFT